MGEYYRNLCLDFIECVYFHSHCEFWKQNQNENENRNEISKTKMKMKTEMKKEKWKKKWKLKWNFWKRKWKWKKFPSPTFVAENIGSWYIWNKNENTIAFILSCPYLIIFLLLSLYRFHLCQFLWTFSYSVLLLPYIIKLSRMGLVLYLIRWCCSLALQL